MSATIATDPSPSLARGAAAISLATAVSRITGFVRVVVIAAALGRTFLANTYQTANTAPNVVFELVAAGVLTSVFVPTFVDYVVRNEREEGWNAASVLTSVALVGLVGLALAVALAAPIVMRLLTIGVSNDLVREREIALGTSFLRLFAPQVVFYGAAMIMTGALHAHRRFAVPAIAPILNNLVVIAVYLTYAAMRSGRPPTLGAITTAETIVLGAGTTMGVVAMTICLVPQLARLGWRYRWKFDLSHPSVAKAGRLGAWALGYAGGYQAGLIIVLILANKIRGGAAAYQWAYTFFYVPHALFAAPIFHVLFPAMSEHAARGEPLAFLGRLRSGMGMLVFILVPTAALMLVTAEPLARVTLEYGVMSQADAQLVGRVIAGFAIGLPAYSAFVVLTRAYYALGDPKTPALVNAATVAASSGIGALLFYAVQAEWSIPALALGHSVGFFLGTAVLSKLLSRRFSHAGSTALTAAIARSIGAGALGFTAMAAARALLPEGSRWEALVGLGVTGFVGVIVYVAGMTVAGSPELKRIAALGRQRKTKGEPPPLKKGKVLQVFGPSAGGTARHVALVTEGLDGRGGISVDVCGPPDVPVEMPKPILPLKIPTGALRGHRAAIAQLRSLLEQGGYSVVHAHGLRAGIDAALAARSTGAQVLLTVHNLVQPEIAGRLRAILYRRAEPLAVRLADHLFAASEQIAGHLKEVAPGAAHKVQVLHAPVGEAPIVARTATEVKEELKLPPDAPLVVTVTRLAPQKALHVMLEALAALPGDVALAVVGEGPLERSLKARADELGLHSRVRWLGFRKDAADFISAADVLCLSSVWEAVSLAAQEAVLLGTVVVATEVGGMSELITDRESGRLVPKGDASALAAALKDVLASEDVRRAYARNASEHLRSRFSKERMLARLEEAYLRSGDGS